MVKLPVVSDAGRAGVTGEWGVSTRRSLFVVLDSLACTDGAISAAAQGWLVRALSLGDVARILEPMLLLLLQPKTQRTSIHCLRQENSAGEFTGVGGRGVASRCPAGCCRSALLTQPAVETYRITGVSTRAVGVAAVFTENSIVSHERKYLKYTMYYC